MYADLANASPVWLVMQRRKTVALKSIAFAKEHENERFENLCSGRGRLLAYGL